MEKFTMRIAFNEQRHPRYEQIARAIEDAIVTGKLRSGERLPTVRELSADLGVSGTTITAAFNKLAERGLICPEVGRGTFVAKNRAVNAPEMAGWFPRPAQRAKTSWRKRTLTNSCARLKSIYPIATDCSMGRPDAALLPFQPIRRAWGAALSQTTHSDLQYSGPEPLPVLAAQVLPRLNADLLQVCEQNLLVGSSAQQFLMLALEVLTRIAGGSPVVAVEDPGYATLMDSYEHAGAKLVGVAIDHLGAVPEALETALAAGAKAVVFTSRGHNPTGCSWSSQRVVELADVLALHGDVIIIEDDQFSGIATTRPGSLLNDERIADRVLYIRSFSKSIGPDFRIAVAAAQPRLRTLIMEAKSFADGWTSRLLQKVMSEVLADSDLDQALDRARDTYFARRDGAARTLNANLFSLGGGTWCGPDGVNLWVHLPPGVDADNVIERAAESGVLVAPGEPFFILPGQSDCVRFNPCSVPVEKAIQVAQTLAEAVIKSLKNPAVSIHV